MHSQPGILKQRKQEHFYCCTNYKITVLPKFETRVHQICSDINAPETL